MFLDDFLASGTGAQAPQLEFEQLPFSHPLFIMFSSGTTGAPKCMVHSAGVGDSRQTVHSAESPGCCFSLSGMLPGDLELLAQGSGALHPWLLWL